MYINVIKATKPNFALSMRLFSRMDIAAIKATEPNFTISLRAYFVTITQSVITP
jgi:hypothetical protein